MNKRPAMRMKSPMTKDMVATIITDMPVSGLLGGFYSICDGSLGGGGVWVMQ